MKALLFPLLLLFVLLAHDTRAQGISLTAANGRGGTIRATWQRPLPQGNVITDVCAVDSVDFWAVGYNGAVLHSSDAGKSWSACLISSKTDFRSVSFLTSSSGWICGRATLFFTDDGGQQWRSFDCPRRSPQRLAVCIDVRMLTDSTVALLSNEGFWRSTDRGASWIFAFDIYKPTCMDFSDATHGWIAGERWRTERTTDGGRTWQEHWVISDGQAPHGIHFSDSLHGLIYDDTEVFLTYNGGRKWISAPDPVTAAAKRDSLLRFHDGSGSGLRDSNAHAWLRSVSFVSKDCGWALGDGILHTLDGGAHWHRQLDAGDDFLTQVLFLDEKRGWVTGEKGRLLSTTDGGVHWHSAQVENANGQRLQSIYFLDDQTGWIAGEKGSVFATTDAGRSWQKGEVPTSATLTDITFLNDRIGYCTGLGGTLAKTTDGGETWQSSSFGENIEITDLAVLSDSCVLLLVNRFPSVSDNKILVLRSSDRGASWTAQSISEDARSAPAMHFRDERHGTILLSDGRALTTSDAGLSWQPLPIPLGFPVVDAAFAAPERIFLVGAHGGIMRIDMNPSTKGERK